MRDAELSSQDPSSQSIRNFSHTCQQKKISKSNQCTIPTFIALIHPMDNTSAQPQWKLMKARLLRCTRFTVWAHFQLPPALRRTNSTGSENLRLVYFLWNWNTQQMNFNFPFIFSVTFTGIFLTFVVLQPSPRCIPMSSSDVVSSRD